MPSPRTAAVGDERDSRPLIGAEGSSSSSSSEGGSSSAAPPGTSGWRDLQKVYGSEVQPPPQLRSHGSIPEEGPVSPDPSFMRFNRGEASAEPPPEHEGSGLPLLQATLSRAQCLCLAQSGLSLAVVACAAVLGEPSWLRWLLLAGVAIGVVELGRVQMNGLSYAALSTRLRAAPPAYLLINTAQPPLMQARDIYMHIPPLVQARDMPCARRTHRPLAPGQTRTAPHAPPEQQLGTGNLRVMRVPSAHTCMGTTQLLDALRIHTCIQALDVLSELRARHATDGGVCVPQLLARSTPHPCDPNSNPSPTPYP